MVDNRPNAHTLPSIVMQHLHNIKHNKTTFLFHKWKHYPFLHVDHVHASWSKSDLLTSRLFSTTPCTFIQYIILGYNGTFYFHFFVNLAMAMKSSTIHFTSNKILLYGLYNKHASLSQWTTTKTRSWVCFVEFLAGVHTKPCWLSCVCCKDINGKSSFFPSFGDIL